MKQIFSLLKTLNEHRVEEKTTLPKGINYQEYVIEVDKQEVTVFIPLRECKSFEETLYDVERIDEDNLRDILRRHRGIKG